MKKLVITFSVFFLFSCTSNTIFKKPKDLIPRDTMSLLIQELMIASSAKYIKNVAMETNIDYNHLVYDMFKIDSTRFKTSNFYYASKIDLYKEILEDAKRGLEKQKSFFNSVKKRQDSVRNISINHYNPKTKKADTIMAMPNR